MLKFEIKKTWRHTPIGLLIMSLLIVFAGLALLDWQAQQTQVRSIMAQNQIDLNHLKQNYATETATTTNQADLQAIKPYYQRSINLLKAMNQNLTQQRPTKFMNNYYQLLDPNYPQIFLVPFLPAPVMPSDTFDSMLKTTELLDTYREIRQLQKSKATPFFPQTVLANPNTLPQFNGTAQREQLVTKLNQRHYLNGWYFIWRLFKENYFLIFLIVNSLFFGTTLVTELKQTNPTIDFLVLRQSHRRIFWTKYLTANLFSFGLITLVLLITFSGLSAIFKTGSLSYPVLTWSRSATVTSPYNVWQYPFNFFNPFKTTFQPLAQYLLKCLLLLIMATLLSNALSFLIGAVTRNTLLTAVLSSSLILLIPQLPNQSWLPLTYLKIDAVATNYLGWQLHQSTTFTSGVLLLIMTTLLLLGLARVIFGIRTKGATR